MTKKKRNRRRQGGAGATEGARRATGVAPAELEEQSAGGLAPGQRWTAARKREVVLRMLRGESLETLSRELGVEIYRLEEWKDLGLAGLDGALRSRKRTAEQEQLAKVQRRLGESMMDNELLREKCRRLGLPLPPGMSKP